MIPANALVAQLQAYIQAPEQPLVQAVDALQEIQQLFTVGEQVRATVTGQLDGGRFAVLVKEQLLDLNLPRNTEAGKSLQLRVLANSPRLTFLIENELPQAAPAQQPKSLPTASASVALSQAGQFLGELLAKSDGGDGKAPAIQGKAPLAQAGAIDSAKLAGALKQALAESGVFYESHLAGWAQGQHPLESLLREPQGQLSSGTGDQAGKPVSRQTDNAEEPAPARSGLAKQENASHIAADGTTAASAGKDELSPRDKLLDVPGLPPQEHKAALQDMSSNLRQLIQQQLQTLDQRALSWHGQAWPGQAVEWELEQEAAGSQQEEPAMKPVWRSRLYLELPRLGVIEASIRLSEQKRVDVDFRVADPDTADRLRRESNLLQARFDAAGLELTSQQIALSEER
ncbi:flagellar hook-length control protein FliK [Chitinimonas sp.]|uniref:flagellar hook-length control protein FliK n=1 Tax=Chitinimonas sp. TaxID=1934313 RepID=UPI0035B4AADD